MSIKLITPAAGAANPAHPDHDRWVKEQTLEREVAHAKASGLSLRAAETANMRALERLAARKRDKKKRKPAAKPQPTKAQLAESGVTRRVATAKQLPVSACNHCGTCHSCKRERRISLILDKARKAEIPDRMAWEIVGLQLASQQRSNYRDLMGRSYPFADLPDRERIRARNAGFDNVCDVSVRWLGAWR